MVVGIVTNMDQYSICNFNSDLCWIGIIDLLFIEKLNEDNK